MCEFKFVYGDVQSHNKFNEIITHAISVADFGKEYPSTSHEQMFNIAELYNEIGVGAYCLGKYDLSLTLYNNSVVIYSLLLKDNDSFITDIATVNDNMASVYLKLEKYEQALSLYNESLKIRENQDSINLATTYNNIGAVYFYMNNFNKAIYWYDKVRELQEVSVEEVNSSAILTTYNNLANSYYKQGEHEKAIELHNRILSVRETTLSKNHPDIAESSINLAHIYLKTNDLNNALFFYEKALIIYNSFGYSCPETALSYDGIANVLFQKQQYEKSLEKYELAYEVSVEILGETHSYSKKIRDSRDKVFSIINSEL